MPTEDRYLMTREELLDTTCALLGGRAAEDIVFGEISTGAANDLQKATQIAESMVKEYGMSDRLGLVAHRESRQQPFLGVPNGEKLYSEETARRIDGEVARIIDESYARAKEVLVERRGVLEKVVEVLFEKEIMEGEELRHLLNGEVVDRLPETADENQSDSETGPDSSGNGKTGDSDGVDPIATDSFAPTGSATDDGSSEE